MPEPLDINVDDAVNAADLEQSILESAIEGVSSATMDGVTVSDHSLRDRMLVADRQKRSDASAQPHRGILFSTFIPGGTG